MITLHFTVNHQRIRRGDTLTLTAGSRDYVSACFTFSEEWEGLTKTAAFKCNGDYYTAAINEDGSCIVPAEVLDDCQSRIISVAVAGTRGDVRIITDAVKVRVLESGKRV